MISINQLNKQYGRQKVLRDINLELERGQSIALIGPNGSGKTTLIKSILGLVIPDSGTILVNGTNIKTGPEYREQIGYMPQISRFPEQMKVQQLFHLVANMRPRIEKSPDISLYQDFHIEKMEQKALGSLSGGMKQQVSAALAFYFNPGIIILDEPTAALDPVSNEILKARINQAVGEDRLVITTSHILNDLDEISNHVIYLMDGGILINKSLPELKQETAETRLNRIIVTILNEHLQHAEN